MSKWTTIEVVHQPDIMDDDEGTGSWEDFRKQVRRNCGAYLKSKGAPDFRGIMDDDTRSAVAFRGVGKARERRNLDEFFERLKQPVESMKRGGCK